MEKLLYKLNGYGINVEVENGNLKLNIPNGFDAQDILIEVKANKQSLISHILENKRVIHITDQADNKHGYKLSSAQQRLYFLYEMDRNSLAYNMPQVVKMEGIPDREQLRLAFNKLINRHESLRTYFELFNGVPVQRVLPAVDFNINIYQAETEADIPDLLKDTISPFLLEEAPLLRVALIELSAEVHLLVIDMHHIITDGISHGILINELIAFYQDETIAPLELTYKDYSEWQQSDQQQFVQQQQRNFWLENFAEMPALLELPIDFNRPLVALHEGARTHFKLDFEESKALRELAAAEEVTLFMLLLAINNVLLGKLGNQEDIVIGVPGAGREQDELNKVIGMFVNTLALRNYPKGELTFQEFLSMVRQNTLSCFDNQAYQFDNLVNELKVPRDTGRNPLFDVMFTYEHQVETSIDIPGLRISGYESGFHVAKFELRIAAFDNKQEIEISFEYASSLFKATTIDRFITYFRKIVTAVITDRSVKLADIDIFSSTAQRELLDGLDHRHVIYPSSKTIVEIFQEQVVLYGEHTALFFQGETMSYAELNRRSNQWAHLLRERGVKPNTIVGLLVDRSMEMVIGMLAILKAGGAYLPIDTDYPLERITYLIADSGIELLLTTLEREIGFTVDTLYLVQDGAADYSVENPAMVNQPADLCYIIYTSGTTGQPKGVMIEHKNVVRLFFNDDSEFDFGSTDVWTMFHSHCFDFSVWEMYGALLYGGELVIISKQAAQDPFVFLQTLTDRGVTILNQTPSAFYNLINAEKDYFENASVQDNKPDLQLRYIIFAGEELKPLKLQSWHAKYPQTKLINMYGITETTVHVTYKEIKEFDILAGRSNIGKPVATLSAYIFDRHLKLVPSGTSGELFIGGEGICRGYLNKESLTAARFIVNPYDSSERLYRTGDLVRKIPSGDLEYLGRIDEQVKIRGYRIELGEIEKVLLESGLVSQAVVVAGGDNLEDKKLIGYFTTDKNTEKQAVIDYLRTYLPDYMVPLVWVKLEGNFPLTANGKLAKKSLPDPEYNDLLVNEYAAPKTEVEKTLVKIWQDILGIKRVGIKDNFFHVGGNSVSSINLVSEINKQLGISIPLKWVFEVFTIEGIAGKIQKRSTWIGNFEPDNKNSEKAKVLKIAHLTETVNLQPFFFSAPLGGILPATSIIGILDMAPYLKDKASFYSIQAPALDTAIQKAIENNEVINPDEWNFEFSAFEKIVDEAVNNLLAIQEQGPYALGGFCSGCVLAMEIAKKLTVLGKEVEKLVLIDPPLWVQSIKKEEVNSKYTKEEIAWFVAKDIGWASPMMSLENLTAEIATNPSECAWEISHSHLTAAGVLSERVKPSELKQAFENKFYNDIALQLFFAGIGYLYPKIKIGHTLVLFPQSSYDLLPPDFADSIRENIFQNNLTVKAISGDHGTLFLPDLLAKWIPFVAEHLMK